MLARHSGVDDGDCQKALKTLLLVASRTEQQRAGRGSDKPFFGVRLHQFISGAGRAHSTIEPYGQRKVVLDAQRFLPDSEVAVLEGHFDLIVGNARHMRNVPGRKTDVKDSEWIADLVRHPRA